MSNYRTIDTTIDVDTFSAMFAALSNSNRLRLFLRIIDHCGLTPSCTTDDGIGACVGDLADGLGIAPSTVSHHLKELRQAGLISMTRHGRTVECVVSTDALRALSTLFGSTSVDPASNDHGNRIDTSKEPAS
ncbi:MAG: ArsR/SmtB family transcription factor [Acidimicrobiales bacterium]